MTKDCSTQCTTTKIFNSVQTFIKIEANSKSKLIPTKLDFASNHTAGSVDRIDLQNAGAIPIISNTIYAWTTLHIVMTSARLIYTHIQSERIPIKSLIFRYI